MISLHTKVLKGIKAALLRAWLIKKRKKVLLFSPRQSEHSVLIEDVPVGGGHRTGPATLLPARADVVPGQLQVSIQWDTPLQTCNLPSVAHYT